MKNAIIEQSGTERPTMLRVGNSRASRIFNLQGRVQHHPRTPILFWKSKRYIISNRIRDMNQGRILGR